MWLMELASSLNSLSLWGNRFTGTIPPQLAQLKSLAFLGLQLNALTGTMPPQLAQMTGPAAFSNVTLITTSSMVPSQQNWAKW
jgi:hypothetical protein